MKMVRLFSGVVAIGAVGILVYRLGRADMLAQFQKLPVILPLVVLAGSIRLFLQTRAWWIALRAEGIEVPQSRLVAVRLASQAAGYLSALGPAVSEPAKLLLLRNSASVGAAAPATLVETGTYWLTTVILGLAGTLAAAFVVSNTRVVWGCAALFGAALVFLATTRSVLSPLVRAAGPRAPGWLRSAEIAELRIRSFRSRQPRAAAEVLVLDAAAQLVTLAEVAAVLWAAGIRTSILHVVAIEAAGRVVKVLGAWIPGRIGADEGGAVASFALLGLPPAAGLTLALARRARDLLWCAAGIAWTAGWRMHRRPAGSVSDRRPLCTEEH